MNIPSFKFISLTRTTFFIQITFFYFFVCLTTFCACIFVLYCMCIHVRIHGTFASIKCVLPHWSIVVFLLRSRFASVSTKLDTFHSSTKKKYSFKLLCFYSPLMCLVRARAMRPSLLKLILMLYFQRKNYYRFRWSNIYIKFVSHFIAMNHDITWENSAGKYIQNCERSFSMICVSVEGSMCECEKHIYSINNNWIAHQFNCLHDIDDATENAVDDDGKILQTIFAREKSGYHEKFQWKNHHFKSNCYCTLYRDTTFCPIFIFFSLTL